MLQFLFDTHDLTFMTFKTWNVVLETDFVLSLTFHMVFTYGINLSKISINAPLGTNKKRFIYIHRTFLFLLNAKTYWNESSIDVIHKTYYDVTVFIYWVARAVLLTTTIISQFGGCKLFITWHEMYRTRSSACPSVL